MSLPSVSKFQVAKNFLFEHSSLVSWAVRKADAVFTAYRDAMPKVDRMYRLPAPSQFLPTPIGIPPQPAKSDHPVVCYIGRLDRRKRPQLLIPVARKFPDVKFVIAGSSRDKAWEAELATGFASLPNVRQLGFVDQFRSPLHQETLEQSWIFANTAKREGLPNSFIEAAANGCAILSSNDPDGFASRFGEHVADDDFTAGLERLLAEDRWRRLGAAGRSYVASTFATELAIQNHVEAYNRVLTTD
jgi:glycosyltransferase involved in cell wall biosynthesis